MARKPCPYTELRFRGTPSEINAQWLEQRKQGIGGSDVASIMGLNKYSSPYEVWLIKTGRAESPDLSDKEAVEWGNRLEDVVADKFAEQHAGEYKVYRKNAMLVSKDRPWAFANLDRRLRDRDGNQGILEVKTVGMRRASDWDEGVPSYYLTQVTHYLSITGYGYAWVAVLIGGQEYREYFIPRDNEDIQTVNTWVDDFWANYVLADQQPAFIGNDSEADAVLAQHEEPSDELLPMLDSDMPALDELATIKNQIDLLKKNKSRIESDLKDMIGDAKGIETETRRITWVRSHRTRFDQKAFEAAYPGIMQEFMTTSVTNGGLRVAERKN